MFISALFTVLCFSLVVPAFANNISSLAVNETPKELLAKEIKTRLMEIKSMDKSELTRAEKKELKKEVKDLRERAKSSGVFLTVGALLIVILLLILLL